VLFKLGVGFRCLCKIMQEEEENGSYGVLFVCWLGVVTHSWSGDH